MKKATIHEVLAGNLKYWMVRKNLGTQTALAQSAGVSQKTISNYLKPEQRLDTSSGRTPSAKLSELEKIAQALDMPVWVLLKPRAARSSKS